MRVTNDVFTPWRRVGVALSTGRNWMGQGWGSDEAGPGFTRIFKSLQK